VDALCVNVYVHLRVFRSSKVSVPKFWQVNNLSVCLNTV